MYSSIVSYLGMRVCGWGLSWRVKFLGGLSPLCVHQNMI